MSNPAGRPRSLEVTPREREWRHTLARWKKSGLCGRAFCRRETLDENLFYHWKRVIRLRDEERRSRRRKRRSSLHWPLHMLPETAPGRRASHGSDRPDHCAEATSIAFHASPGAPKPDGHAAAHSIAFHPVRLSLPRQTDGGPALAAPFEVAFQDGRLLRVPPDFDSATLQRLLALLDPPGGRSAAQGVAPSAPRQGGSPC